MRYPLISVNHQDDTLELLYVKKRPSLFQRGALCISSQLCFPIELKVTSPRLSQRGEVFKLLFPAQKQKRDAQDYELETNKQS